jgi:hypothetical protein
MWGSDFRRRMMFESMIEYKYKEEEEVEKVQEKYLGEMLGVNRETPGEKKRTRRRRRRRNTTRGTGMLVKKWKD